MLELTCTGHGGDEKVPRGPRPVSCILAAYIIRRPSLSRYLYVFRIYYTLLIGALSVAGRRSRAPGSGNHGCPMWRGRRRSRHKIARPRPAEWHTQRGRRSVEEDRAGSQLTVGESASARRRALSPATRTWRRVASTAEMARVVAAAALADDISASLCAHRAYRGGTGVTKRYQMYF